MSLEKAIDHKKNIESNIMAVKLLTGCAEVTAAVPIAFQAGNVHKTNRWQLVQKWQSEQLAMGIPSRLINVGCMMEYMAYTPRTLNELLHSNLEESRQLLPVLMRKGGD